MENTITIDRAIKRGRNILMFPSLAIIFLPSVLTYLIADWIFNVEIFFMIYFAIFGVCILPGWLWWSFLEPKWKIWAYANIKTTDIVELKRRAILNGLIWPDGSNMNKTEVWTKQDIEKMEKVAERYKHGLRWR